MRILGIDPGLRLCGYAVVDSKSGTNTLVEAGVLRIDTKPPLEYRLRQIDEDIEAVLDNLKPEIVAVEKLYSHYAHPETAILMGHARGVILQKAASKNIEVKSFAATRIKKSLTGNGRASKNQMQLSIQTVLALSEPPQPNDVADAIAVALCCGNALNLENGVVK